MSVAEATVSLDSGVLAGLAAASGHPTALHAAEFQDVSLLGLSFRFAPDSTFTAPSRVQFELLTGAGSNSVAKIEFFANGSKIGEVINPSFDLFLIN